MNCSRDRELDYRIIRSRRRTADIVIERDGSIVVRAPHHVDDAGVAQLVDARRYWIHRSLAEWREANASRVTRDYRSGESFPYLGRNYRLSLVADQPEPLLLKNGRFLLRRDILAGDSPHAARNAFRHFYQQKGEPRLAQRVAHHAPLVGVRPGTVTVRDLGFRWASCSPSGNLAFHWKCLMAPLTVIDYLVVHELCHFHHRDHSEDFWNEVDKVLPRYRERRAWLRQHGASLDL